MTLRQIKRKIVITWLSGLLASTLSIIAAPASVAIAPVGATNPTAYAINNNPLNVGVATLNSASAIAITNVSSTQTARSVGLAEFAATSTSNTYQDATVQLSGVLSLYTLTATNVAYVADGGTWSSPVGNGFTLTTSSGSTAVSFTRAATATATVSAGILWTAPSTSGTYTISVYRGLQTSTTFDTPSTTRFAVGEEFDRVQVTVGGSHPAPGGTNAPDTLGNTNSSMFVAVASSTGTGGVAHPVTTLGTGEDAALSKGLLAKDSTFGTAQTATVLAGGVLSLYGIVSTAAAFSASGGTFSSTQSGMGDDVVTYSSSNQASVINSDLMTTVTAAGGTPATAVATLWAAPTTAGTYTVSLLTGWVQSSTGSYSAPTTSTLPPTLAAKITVTVVASSAGGSLSAAYSVCNTATTTTAASSSYPTGVDSSSTVADGGVWYIDYDLNDAYNANLSSGNIVATATNGALINIGTTAGTAPVLGTASTDTVYTDGASETVIISQPTAGAPLTTTVTLSYNGTVFCTKTVTIRGKVASLEVANVGTGSLSSQAGSAIWIQSNAGTITSLPAGLFTVVARDSAGNLVSTNSTLGSYSSVASTLTTTVQAVSVTQRSSSASSTSANRFNVGTWYCGDTAGSSNVKIKFTTTATGEVVESPAFAARCASSPYTYTASFDKTSYLQGDVAKLTVQFLDSKGNKSNTVVAPGASTLTLPMLTSVDYASSATAVTKADGSVTYSFTVGGTDTAFTAGTYTGVVNFSSLTAQVPATVTYTLKSASTDVPFSDILKSVVALIASINKQIQALQKLILNRKR